MERQPSEFLMDAFIYLMLAILWAEVLSAALRAFAVPA